MNRKEEEGKCNKMHAHARRQLTKYMQEFKVALIRQSELLAAREKADVVLGSHMKEAYGLLTAKRRRGIWVKESGKIFGGIFFGLCFTGVRSALAAQPVNATSVLIHMALGFLGLLMIFVGISGE